MSKYIIIEKEKLEDLRIKNLALCDFLMDLEFYMKLLNIPFESSIYRESGWANFLESLISLTTDAFPPDRCRDFQDLAERANAIVWKLNKENTKH